MPHQFDLLPIELQSSIVELRAASVDEAVIEQLIERTLSALVVKSNRVQVEVWQIEERLGTQLEQIGLKVQADLQTQHGATNGMLIELRAAQLEAHPQIREARQDVAELKKSWLELAAWRSRVEATLTSYAESRDQSKIERAELKALSTADRDESRVEIRKIATRLTEIERLLQIAGEHEAGK